MGGIRFFRPVLVFGLVFLGTVAAGPQAHAQDAKVSPKIEIVPNVPHSASIESIAFSPDGARVLSGGAETAKLWDVATGALLLTFEGHSGRVNSVAFSPDGARVLSGSQDETVKLWDATTGGLLRTFEGHSNEVLSVAFSPDGARVLSGGWDKTVKLWDATTGGLLRTFEGGIPGRSGRLRSRLMPAGSYQER